MYIDINKYGFELYLKATHGSLFYRRVFNGFYIELVIAANIYSLTRKADTEDREMIIANRYRIDTQEQFDFLINNSRVAEWFT